MGYCFLCIKVNPLQRTLNAIRIVRVRMIADSSEDAKAWTEMITAITVDQYNIKKATGLTFGQCVRYEKTEENNAR